MIKKIQNKAHFEYSVILNIDYGVASVSRIDKMIGPSCKRAL